MLYENIIKAFNRAGVKYAIAGGIAVGLHGYLRLTHDLDLLLKLDDRNLATALSILKKAGFKCKIPVDPMDFANGPTRRAWIRQKHVRAVNFFRGIEEIDILVDTPVTYERIKKQVYDAGGLEYPVVSKADLIKMKTGTGRPQDREDIRQLTLLMDAEKPRRPNRRR